MEKFNSAPDVWNTNAQYDTNTWNPNTTQYTSTDVGSAPGESLAQSESRVLGDIDRELTTGDITEATASEVDDLVSKDESFGSEVVSHVVSDIRAALEAAPQPLDADDEDEDEDC